MSDFFVDEFVNIKPGEPYRLFPFGTIVKNGKKREITREYASTFRLPHFKPPIKLGSHKEETPAGGHIARLEVRQDGLYAVPEFIDTGAQAMKDGAYRYHSPEVIFEGGLEDPTTGEIIPGPLIVGDALLHTPHLGEATALYTIEPIPEGDKTMTDNYTVPASFFDKFMAFFDRKDQTPEPPQPKEQPENYAALAAQNEQFAAEIATLKAEQAKTAQRTAIKAEFAPVEFGAAFQGLGTEATVDILATMTDEQRTWTLTQFKALSAQIKEADLTGNVGRHTETQVDPVSAFNAAIVAEMEASKADYPTAMKTIAAKQPELVQAYLAVK